MALAENDLALLTARFGCARFGASRFGFIPCPEDVHGVGFDEPGEYIWKEVKPPTTSWTLQTEDCVCGQRPVAGFSNVLCNAVGPVAFTDTSTPADEITFWYWTFGDGGTSSLQNPTHTYAAGYFTVTLTVSSEKGSSTATGYVSVMSALVASADPNPANAGQDVTFDPTFTGGLAPYTYLWDFTYPKLFAAWNMDDAVGAVTQSSVRQDWLGNYDLTDQWAAPGTVTVAAGKIGDATGYALAGGVAFSDGLVTLPTTFTITGWFKISDGTQNQYLFSYGPNTLSGGVNIHVWPSVFDGVRFFTDDDGGDAADSGVAITLNSWHFFAATHDAATGENTVQVDGSVPVVVATQPDPAAAQTLRLGRHSGGAGQLYGSLDAIQVWDEVLSQGEINALAVGWEPSISTDETPALPFPTAGAVVASLTVTSASGCVATDTVAVTVVELIAEFTNVNDSPGVGDVHFTDTTSGGTAPYTYAWDFGDGEASSQQSPDHTYTKDILNPETFTVTLTVTDSLAVVDSVSHDVIITWVI